MFCHTNLGSEASLGVVDGLEELGLRGVVAFGPEDGPSPTATRWPGFLAEHEALAERCAASELVGFRLGVGTVLGQTDELLAASARAAREHGWAVHTHLAEVREEVVGPGCAGAAPAWSGPPTSACWTCRWWPGTASGSSSRRSLCWPRPGSPWSTTRWPT